MSNLKHVTMTTEEYAEYCRFLKEKENVLTRSHIKPNCSDITNKALSEISQGFSSASFEFLKDKISFWKYPKGSKVDLSTESSRCLGYLVKGIIKTTVNSEFLNFTTPKNWLGTLVVSQALISDDNDSWMMIKNYSTKTQMFAQTDTILATIELDKSTLLQLKKDHIFKNTLLSDLISIIRANDSLQFLLMHRNKVSLMASYLLWKLEKEGLRIWKPIPTELSERLNFSLSDTRRSIDKLLSSGAIIAGKEFDRNTKKRFYYFSDNAKEKLLGISGLDQQQIKDLSRILFDSVDDDCELD